MLRLAVAGWGAGRSSVTSPGRYPVPVPPDVSTAAGLRRTSGATMCWHAASWASHGYESGVGLPVGWCTIRVETGEISLTAVRKPRVLVDATSVPADRGGVGRYVDGLLGALGRRSDVDLAVVCQRTDAERYQHALPGAEVVPAPAAVSHRPARLAWEQTGLPLVAQQVNADVVHSPHYTMPLRAGRPVVVTIHDATFFTEPDLHTSVKGTFFRSATRTALRRAARVVTPSKATRDELIRVLDADGTKIDVAYHGVDQTTFHVPTDAEKDRVQARLGLGGQPYIAFLSTLEPRK